MRHDVQSHNQRKPSKKAPFRHSFILRRFCNFSLNQRVTFIVRWKLYPSAGEPLSVFKIASMRSSSSMENSRLFNVATLSSI